jgi:hypothetical protein
VTLIYHITHINNLPHILAEGRLVCDSEAADRQLCEQSIAHATLKQRRARTPVIKNNGSAIGANGVLADYVPFYFTNRSPMLFAIHKGAVLGYDGDQTSVVYLVSSAEDVAASNISWCFTDGHAVEEVSEFYDQLQDLKKIDWKVIQNWSWKNTLSDLDRKRRKQAEFLVYHEFPWDLVSQIGVINKAMATRVQEAIRGLSHKPELIIEPKWYYNI